MRIIDILNQKDVTLSFEVFPPKTDSGYSSVASATESIAALKPDFMSVTYGAGGGTSKNTLNIAANLREKYGTEVLPHLTCVSSIKSKSVGSPESCNRKDLKILWLYGVIFRRTD